MCSRSTAPSWATCNIRKACASCALVTLARDLALGVIVEGLETEAQLDFVRRLGVELAQGNLLGPPADAAGAGRLVTK